MAGIRHLIDTEAHKALFDKLKTQFGDDVGAVIQALEEHNKAGNAHGATPDLDPNTIMRRDAAGRVRVADPVHQKDVVNKGYVDALVQGATRHVFTVSGTYSAPFDGVAFALLVGGGQGGGKYGKYRDDNSVGGTRGRVAFTGFYPVFAGQQVAVSVGAGGQMNHAAGGNTAFLGFSARGGGGGGADFICPTHTWGGAAGADGPKGSQGDYPGGGGGEGGIVLPAAYGAPAAPTAKAGTHGDYGQAGQGGRGWGAGGGGGGPRNTNGGAGAPGIAIIITV